MLIAAERRIGADQPSSSKDEVNTPLLEDQAGIGIAPSALHHPASG